MAISQRGLEKLQLLSVHPVAARTATGDSTSVDLQTYDGDLALILDSAAAGAGTNPTLDVSVEHSDEAADNFTQIGTTAFTRVTSTASRQILVISKDETKRYVRVKYTIGGTNSPSFTFSVTGVGVKKYG
jgi:hypothetical protein